MSLTPELRQRDFFVTRTVGAGHSNPHDVLRTRKALNVTGHAHSPPNPSKLFDPSLIRSLDRFQRDWGLKEDSVINPSGPTENTLELAVAATRAGGRDGAELLRGPVSVLNRHGLRFDRDPDDTLGPVPWRDRDGNAIPLDRVRGFLSQADTSKETETARRGIQVAAAATGSGAAMSDAVPPQAATNPGFRALAERLFGRRVIPDDESAAATGVNDQAAPVGDTDAGNDTLGGTGSTGPVASETASPPVQLAQRGGADPWVVKDAKGAGPNNPDFDPWPTSPISKQFRTELHKEESKDRNYLSVGKKGALGRYQMTQIGLEEAKMKDAKGRWTGKYGIRSAQDFLNDPLAQEKALADLMKKNEGYIKFYKLDHHFGRKVDGVQAKFTISRNGLLAALHRRGIGTAQEYFRHLDKSGWNTAGTKMSQRLIHFETRLRKFEGVTYDQP